MKISSTIASRAALRRAAALLVAVPSLLVVSPTAAHAATAAPGTLRCEGASTVITHQPTVSVGAGETAGYFAWLPALVDLNGRWAIYNFGYDHRSQRSFNFGYSSASACTFAPNLFTPNR